MREKPMPVRYAVLARITAKRPSQAERWLLARWLVVLIVGATIGASVHAQSETTLRLATGPSEGSYYIIGNVIRQVVEASIPNLRIELLTSKASLENLALIQRGEVDLALAQNDVVGEISGQLAKSEQQVSYQTLLVLMQEPVQIVVGPPMQGETLSSLSARPLAIGWQGSGVYFTASEVLKTLKIEFSKWPVQSPSEVVEALRQQRAHAGFFVSSTPNPQVAYLLADPSFRLFSFRTQEMDALHDASPYYASTIIPEHSYPNQKRPVTTISVLTVLLCRSDVPAETSERLTMALLQDAASPASSLCQSHSGVNLAAILQLTDRAAVPLHPGAEHAVQTLPLSLRAQAYIHWLQWSIFMMLTCLTLAVAYFRRPRLSLMNLMAPRLPISWTRSLRPLFFHQLLWRIIRTIGLLVLVWLMGSAAMYLVEREVNVNFANLELSSLSILVYLFSGLEDRVAVTTEGWAVSVLMLISGLVVGAYITGQFASTIMQHTLGVIQMSKNIANRGLLVIGWNPRAERILREFFEAFETGLVGRNIAVLSEEKVDTARFTEFESRGVTFVSGNTFDKKVLGRIGAHEAHSIIVLADDNAEDPDAKTALTVLALRSLRRDKGMPDDRRPRICAEVVNHRKRELIRDAGVDEVVCHEDYGLGLLAQSAFSAKITQVYDELLAYSVDTCEIYMLNSFRHDSQGDIPGDVWDALFEGKSFAEASEVFNSNRDSENPAILIGVRRGERVFLNPRNQFNLERDDDLIVIAWIRPRLERLRAAIPERPM